MTSTFKLQPEGIPVTVPKGVEHDEIRNFHPFNVSSAYKYGALWKSA